MLTANFKVQSWEISWKLQYPASYLNARYCLMFQSWPLDCALTRKKEIQCNYGSYLMDSTKATEHSLDMNKSMTAHAIPLSQTYQVWGISIHSKFPLLTVQLVLYKPSNPGIHPTVTESWVTLRMLRDVGASGAEVTSSFTVVVANPISFLTTHP